MRVGRRGYRGSAYSESKKTIRNVTIVVPVTPQTTTINAAAMNAAGWRVARAVHLAKREKGDEE